MWNAPRRVHFHSVMNRKSSGTKAELMIEKQLEMLKRKSILLTWLLQTGGGGVGCRTAPGGKGHLDLENLGPGLCDQFSCSSRRAWERHPHELGITEVMATGNSRSLKCGHFLRRCLSHYCIEGQVTARLPCSCYEKITVWRVHIYYKPGCQLVSITLMQLIFKKLSLLLNSYKIL